MPSLPPLRTAREAAALKTTPTAPPAIQLRPPVNSDTPRNFLAGPAHAPVEIRKMLGDLLGADLIDSREIDSFISNVGPKLSMLNSRDRAAAAMNQHGLLTAFQAERLVQGNLYGLVIGNYRVQDRLSAGTVGTVFKAIHKTLKRPVAIKIVPADDSVPPQFLERFDSEMEMLARIDHPNVVRIFDTGQVQPTEPGLPPLNYAVLEFIDGGDLENFVYHNGTLPPGIACEFGRQLASGLAAAHALNLVHRDLKPSNILVSRDRRAKIIDLGLARHFASTSTPRPGLVGSIEFMPPEQVADAGIVGPPGDMYALGATLFWALTGQLPYVKAISTRETLDQIRHQEPRRLSEVNPSLPADLEELVARLLSRNPADRPTAHEATQLLATFADATAHPSFDNVALPMAESQLDLARSAIEYLEHTLAARNTVADDSAAAVLAALARVAVFRGEIAGQAQRVQHYVQALAGHLAEEPDWVAFADPAFLNDVLRAIPARNVGLVGVPDEIVAKSGELTRAEQTALERHTTAGCHLIDYIVARHGRSLPFGRIARDVIRSHHEKWDGSGFPDQLKAKAIPHAARLVALAEAYDALRQPLGTEPGLTHEQAVEGLMNESGTFFDPAVIDALARIHVRFDQIFASIPD
jgi:serine/threonine protein kinase